MQMFSSDQRRAWQKIRSSYCHLILFFTGDCAWDLLSRCSVLGSQQFLQNYETNQPVTTLCTSHFSPPPLKWQQLALLPWCFIFHILNLKKHVEVKAAERCSFVVDRSEWDTRMRHLFFFSQFWEKIFSTQFSCFKHNYTTLYSKNSIMLAGYFDQEAWHS